MDVSPSIVILNKYKILSEIGKGKFGVVYKGLHLRTHQEIAIKSEPTNAAVRILKHETTILNYLYKNGCRNIPFIFWFGLHNNITYLIMSYYTCSLYDYFRRMDDKNKQKDEETNIQKLHYYMTKIMEIIENIHCQFVVHRDIKPQNFMLDENENLFLIDFGLASIYVDENKKHIPCNETKKECILGTPKYISYYVHEGYEPVRRDDLISLGYMYIYLFQGSLPWEYPPIYGETEYPEIHILNEKNQFIKNKKKWENMMALCSPINEKIGRYMEYCYRLQFNSHPEYRGLQSLFL